jgi:hypothetical protein
MQVSTCLVQAVEDGNCFGEISFFLVSNVSKWNEDQRLGLLGLHLTNLLRPDLCSV